MSPVTNEFIGERVKVARKDAKLTLNALGDLVGKSKQNLSNIERGDCTLSYALAMKIAKACNVPADFFVELGAPVTNEFIGEPETETSVN